MKMYLLMLLLFTTSTALAEDPFKHITHHKLRNGLKVILAPDSKTQSVQVKITVGVGFVHEQPGSYGVSHLLEHVLFRNSKLKDDMSYLQLIKEKEGKANGTTTWDRTNYFATVKKEYTSWMISNFHEMIMKPTLSPKHVQTEKKTVLLEIGEPSPVAKVLGFDPLDFLVPSYLDRKDFWEKYFNVKMKKRYSNTEEQLSTLDLTHAQVVSHYKKYYDPSNMQIIVAGNFNKDVVLGQIVDLWSSIPTNGKGSTLPKYKPDAPSASSIDYSIAQGTPRITVGYLVSDISAREKEVVLSYIDYLSHRVMKKLRNVSGETYTAHDSSELTHNFGYFALTLQSSRDKFNQNFDTIKKMMEEELIEGKLTNLDISEAKRLYLNYYYHWSQSVEGTTKLAEKMQRLNEYEGFWESPYEVLSSITPEQYRLILKKFGQKEHKYVRVKQPELLFLNDSWLLTGFTALMFFFFFRYTLQKPFLNDEVRWVRKVRFPPLKMMELFVGCLIGYGILHTGTLAQSIMDSAIFSSLGIIVAYIEIPVWAFTIIATAQAVISYFPRKLYLMNENLVIKSLSYYSSHIPLSHIKSVSHCSLLEVMTSPSKWPKLFMRFFYFDAKFWRSGLLIELKSGKMYFFSTKDSKASAAELKGILERNQKEFYEERKAA